MRTKEGEQAERQRKAEGTKDWNKRHQAAKREAGLVPLQVWTRPELKEQVKAYNERLLKQAAK